MTYPHPMDDTTGFAEQDKGDCDCCGKFKRLSKVWAFGIETYACDACRGHEDGDE